jgi:hypothetical protein
MRLAHLYKKMSRPPGRPTDRTPSLDKLTAGAARTQQKNNERAEGSHYEPVACSLKPVAFSPRSAKERTACRCRWGDPGRFEQCLKKKRFATAPARSRFGQPLTRIPHPCNLLVGCCQVPGRLAQCTKCKAHQKIHRTVAGQGSLLFNCLHR